MVNGPGGDHPSSDDEVGAYHIETVHHVSGGSLGALKKNVVCAATEAYLILWTYFTNSLADVSM